METYHFSGMIVASSKRQPDVSANACQAAGQINNVANKLTSQYDQITSANRRRASQGVAIAALPSIHETAHKYQVSVGVGGYDGYAAAAIGLEIQPIENLQFRVAYTIAKDNNAIGGGLGFSW